MNLLRYLALNLTLIITISCSWILQVVYRALTELMMRIILRFIFCDQQYPRYWL
ncbi:hypothetical protein ACJMK2_003182 [Sinanodonta woodiana]|uniref:Uncharacterized protein n=1 Tax=Sinanodonta woodiana TaxID=1069815 RepID=A0ABD3XZB7_SINWO